jgi:hypothetical protein
MFGWIFFWQWPLDILELQKKKNTTCVGISSQLLGRWDTMQFGAIIRCLVVRKLLLKHLLNEPQVFVSECHIVMKTNGFSRGHILLFFYEKNWGNLGKFCFSSVNSTNFLGFFWKKKSKFSILQFNWKKKNCSKWCIVKKYWHKIGG